MLWAALLPGETSASARIDSLAGLAVWCLQFTPRVTTIEALSPQPAVAMELEASVRLFGGRRKLAERIRDECGALGVRQLSWAPTSLAAVALARAGVSNGYTRPLEQVLDALPIDTLGALAAHADTLQRLGCSQLGQVRALPRGGIGRRFDAQVLEALDQAYGLRPEAHVWATLAEAFTARIELMSRIEMAPAMLFGARRLLLQMCAWLAARHAGVTAFTLRWSHDSMRHRSAGDGGELTVRTAEPTRDIEHLTRLLAELLAHVALAAPVLGLELAADEVQDLVDNSRSLLPDARHATESLALLNERFAARLGPQNVLRPVVLEDDRLEWMCHWQPAAAARPRQAARTVDIPQPTFVLPEPLRLHVKDDRPLYQGMLQLLAGPHRVEGGWWHRARDGDNAEIALNVTRDYWVALSEHAGVLWVFRTRLGDDAAAWFLHGSFS